MATLKTAVDPVRDHIAGNPDASITLVEYGDYECPHCAKAQPVVAAVREAMGDRLRFVFRNFPLSEMHHYAQKAAEAAEAAGELGRFWEMHDAIFAHQRSGLGVDKLLEIARSVGADPGAIERALEVGTYAEHVREDFMSGIRSGVNGTPTFFVNGTRHDDSWDADTLIEALSSPGAG
jgi:protein-disulfide isomerase